jgi:hypothetical protein
MSDDAQIPVYRVELTNVDGSDSPKFRGKVTDAIKHARVGDVQLHTVFQAIPTNGKDFMINGDSSHPDFDTLKVAVRNLVQAAYDRSFASRLEMTIKEITGLDDPDTFLHVNRLIEQLHADQVDNEQELAEIFDDLGRQEAAVRDAQREVEQANEKVAAERARLTTDQTEFEQERTGLYETQTQLNRDVRDRDEEIRRNKSAMQEMESALQSARDGEQLEDGVDIEELEQQIELLRAEIGEYQTREAKYGEEIASKEKIIRERQAQIDRAPGAKEIKGLQDRIAELERQNKNLIEQDVEVPSGSDRIARHNARENETLKGRVAELTQRLEKLKQGGAVYDNQFDACMAVLRDYAKRLPVFAEGLATVVDREKVSGEINELFEKIQINTIKMYGGETDLLKVVDNIANKVEDGVSVEDLLGGLYDSFHPDFSEYQEESEKLSQSRGAVKVLKDLTGDNSAPIAVLNQAIEASAKIVSSYETDRNRAIENDLPLVEEALGARANLERNKEKKGGIVQAFVESDGELPLMISLGRVDDDYKIKLILPFEKEYALKFNAQDDKPEDNATVGLRELHNRILSKAIFGGDQQPRYNWFKTLTAKPVEQKFQNGTEDIELLCYEFSLSTEYSFHAVQDLVNQMATSIHMGFATDPLYEEGLDLALALHVDPDTRVPMSPYIVERFERLSEDDRRVFKIIYDHAPIKSQPLTQLLLDQGVRESERKPAIDRLKTAGLIVDNDEKTSRMEYRINHGSEPNNS